MNFIFIAILTGLFGSLYLLEILSLKVKDIFRARMMKVGLGLLPIVLPTIVALGVIILFSVDYGTINHDPLKIEIQEGATLSEITERLLAKNLISNRYLFRIAVEILNKSQSLQAGIYVINTDLSTFELIQYLSKGGSFAQRITIPEGTTVYEVGSILAGKLAIDSAAFVDKAFDTAFIRGLGLDAGSMEGFLFPETYDFPPNIRPEAVISRMYSELKYKLKKRFYRRMLELDMSLNEVLTLASIIEDEAKLKREQPIISGVYHNRLKKGMLLQADPTVRYALKKFKDPLLYKDLEVNREYNTYLYPGLPPGPISNPGLDAIEAALYPDSVEYLYFVSERDGSHYFSRTVFEHNRAKNRIKGKLNS